MKSYTNYNTFACLKTVVRLQEELLMLGQGRSRGTPGALENGEGSIGTTFA